MADPEYIYAISDACGFIGAFSSVAEAKEKVLAPYSLVPFLIQRFRRAPGDAANVWAIPYRETNATAFVSNDREVAIRAQKALLNVGLTYPDSVDYWEQPLGRPVPAACERLASAHRAHQIYAGETVTEEEKAREQTSEEIIKAVLECRGDPIDRLIQENERISFLDCVVDMYSAAEDAASDEEDATSSAAEDASAELANSVSAEYVHVDAHVDAQTTLPLNPIAEEV
jgi:hypothetical protein